MITTLVRNLSEAARAVQIKNTKKSFPLLAHTLITVHEGRMILACTDLHDPKVCPVNARIEEPFAACVPSKPFRDWLRVTAENTPKGKREAWTQIRLTYDAANQILTAICDNARLTLRCLPADEFPSVSLPE